MKSEELRMGRGFLQSAHDFPLTVSLGKKVPAWGLSRWNGNLQNGDGLRFVPPDDEGFTLWGDRQRLVYKGRRRSHRFTILGDTSFEYDCILNREPESNIITLLMKGAERFDFFRQPDFLNDPFLAGSYAVYKKETLVGEGTGKLCHIHRPEIIDSRGRRVWGDLSVTGNRLCITIPETWLSEAEYPVVVDPTIGTTTVGSQTHWNNVDNESYDQLFFEVSLGVNRFLIGETFTGTATAYVYAYDSDYEGRCKPVLYSDNGNVPLSRKSKSEGVFDIAVTSGKPAGWRGTTFQAKETLAKGSYIWFGLFCDWFAPRFDYGAKCYWDFWDRAGDDILDTYPLWRADSYYDFKLSMYFTYTSAQNYTRTLTQGVKLAETRKLTASYKRSMSMNTNGITILGRTIDYYRKYINAVSVSDTLNRFRGFFRSVAEQVKTGDVITCCRDFLRTIALTLKALTEGKRNLSARRDIADHAETGDSTARQRGFIRTLLAGVTAAGYTGKIFTLFRTVREEAAAFGEAGHWGDYLRGLYIEAGSMAETNHAGDYHRTVEDTAHNEAASLRHLFVLIRLITLSLVRDYITGRFLKSKEELVIKSPVCRELILESTLH
jgi:hypothetical protein